MAELTFSYPLWTVALALLGGVGYAAAMYYRDGHTAELPLWARRVLPVLRGTAATAILLLLLGPMLRTVTNEVEKPIIVLAQDLSASVVTNRDSAWYRTEYPKQLKAFIDKVSDRYTVEPYGFHGQVVALPDTLRFMGQRTDMSMLFDDLESRYANRNVGAVVVASDGVFNRGIDPNYRPLNLSTKVYTVALGDTSRPLDMLVRRLEHNRYAYLGNEFPLEAELEADLLRGSTMRVKLMDDDGVLAQRDVAVTTDRFKVTLPFKIKASKPGLMRYRVEVEAVNGEITRRNNSKEALVEVIDSRQKVLILADAPHPDVATIKQALRTNINLEVQDQLISEANVEPNGYGLIILHQLPSATQAGRDLVDKIMATDVPLWIIVGPKTDIRSFNGMQLGASINSPNNTLNAAFPAIDSNFGLFNLDEGLRRLMPKLPPLNARFGDHPIGPQAQIFLNQRIGAVETDMWLMAFTQLQGRKLALTAGDGLWRWAYTDHRENGSPALIHGLIQKTVQYLAVMADRSQFRVTVGNSFMEDEPVLFNAELYNDAYEAVNTPDVNLTVRQVGGPQTSYDMGRTETAYRLNAGMLRPGDYSYTAKTKLGDKLLEASGRFRVGALQAEALNTVADHRSLANMARSTGGQLFQRTQLDALADSVLASPDIKNVIYSQEKFRDAIDMKWLFALIALLLATEWALRRWGGVY